MKTLLRTLLTVAFLLPAVLFAQLQFGISYQAVLRDSDNQVLSNRNATLKVNLTNQDGSVVYYTEQHEATTNTFGLITLVIGKGTPVTGSFGSIPWSQEAISLIVELKISPSTTFTVFEIQELQGVPYAFHAANGINATNPQQGETVVYHDGQWVSDGTLLTNEGTVRIKPKAGHDPEEPIFSVLNSDNQVVFAVYESGVRAYVDDGNTKRPKGGFAVGGFSTGQGKEEGVHYLTVTPDSTRIYFNGSNDGKRPKGGFAVGGFSTGQGKSADIQYFTVAPDSTRIYFNESDEGGKRPKGGFAVGGFSTGKGNQSYLNVTPSLTQVSFADDGTKRPKGGFAVGGFSGGKDDEKQYFRVSRDSTIFTNIVYAEEDLLVGGSVTDNMGKVQDWDGNEYGVVTIGKQLWMAENLKTTKNSYGGSLEDFIVLYKEPTSPDSISFLLNTYGYMYEYGVLYDNDICPVGWRVPTLEDWYELFGFVGGGGQSNPEVVFQQLAENSALWNNNFGQTNASGFSARPGGIRNFENGEYENLNSTTHFLVHDLYDFSNYVKIDAYEFPSATIDPVTQGVDFPYAYIRCVKNK